MASTERVLRYSRAKPAAVSLVGKLSAGGLLGRGSGWGRVLGNGHGQGRGSALSRPLRLRSACAEKCVKMEVAGVEGSPAMVSKRYPKVAPEERLLPSLSQQCRETVSP